MISTTVVLVGSLQGLLLATVLWVRQGPLRPAYRFLAALLVTICVVCICIVLANADPYASVYEQVEIAGGLLLGPLLLGYVRSLLRPGEHALRLWHFLPALGAALLGAGWAAGFLPEYLGVRLVVAHQIGYTLWSGVTYLRVDAAARLVAREHLWVRALLGIFVAVHGVQIARMVGLETGMMQNAVPLLAIGATYVLGYLALRTGEHAQALAHFTEALTVLRELAARLSKDLSKDEFVARVGGDEFVVALSYLSPQDDWLQRLSSQLQEAIRQPIDKARPLADRTWELRAGSIVVADLDLLGGHVDDAFDERADHQSHYVHVQIGDNAFRFF